MMPVILCWVLVGFAASARSKKLPDYIVACASFEDYECIVKRANEVIPILAKGDIEYGVQVLDPLFLGDINIKYAGLTAILKSSIMTGLSKLLLSDIKIEPEKGLIVANGTIPELVMMSKYTINGNNAVFYIEGEGDSRITFRNIKATLTFWLEIVKGSDGKDHLHVKKDEMKQNMEKAEFRLDNLFNGNKTLGDNANKMMNNLWRPIIGQFGPPITKKVQRQIAIASNAIFSNVPFEEMTS